MEVILKEDVENLGVRGDVIKVADGYGRNYLLPRGLAVKITAGNLKHIEQEKRRIQARQRKDKAEAERLKSRLEDLEVTIKRKVGETETLYGSVTNADIAEALAEKGHEIDKRKIVLEEPIKSLGDYQVPIRIFREVTAELKVWVVKE
jgi:large subunit ribosomal protein L9